LLIDSNRLPVSIATSNLSVLVQELNTTWLATCSPGILNELPMERFLRLGAGASTNVDAFTVNQLERARRIAEVLGQAGVDLDEEERRAVPTGELRDVVGTAGGWFSSTGKVVTDPAVFAEVVAYARAAMPEEEADQLGEHLERAGNAVVEYTSLKRHSREFHSAKYTYSKERCSKHVSWTVDTQAEGELECDGLARLESDVGGAPSGGLVSSRVAKQFDLSGNRAKWWFAGLVIASAGRSFQVQFTDGEEMTMSRDEVTTAVVDFQTHCASRVDERTQFSSGPRADEGRKTNFFGKINRVRLPYQPARERLVPSACIRHAVHPRQAAPDVGRCRLHGSLLSLRCGTASWTSWTSRA
jgi:hypothetical protein